MVFSLQNREETEVPVRRFRSVPATQAVMSEYLSLSSMTGAH